MLALFAALFIILGVPVLFLSVPAAGMFLPVVAIWIVVTSIVIGGAYLAFGRKGVLVASGVFFAFVAWAIGRGVIGPRVIENMRCSASDAMTLQPRRITRPARVVLDDVQRIVSYDKYHPLDMVAVVTGAEVVEIERLARGHIGGAWSTKALWAIRHSQPARLPRPSNDLICRSARRNVSWVRSSASCCWRPDMSVRVGIS